MFGSAPDAARADATAQDVGPRDVGVDARVDAAIDVGLPDVGLVDVGLPDTGIDGGFDGSVLIADGGLDGSVLLVDAGLDAGRDAATSDGGLDAGRDGGTDGGLDAGLDAGRDGGADGGSDAGRDGGTDAASDAGHRGPAPVLLGMTTDLAAPGAYVLIGQTGITNVVGSMISGGNLGVYPASSTAITGFGLILDSSGQFSSSVSVISPAHIYAANYAVPTPSNLNTAINAMHTAYTDAATRVLPDFLNLSSGHLGGLTLAPGLYAFGSSVDMTAGVTLDGGTNDVWIFQVTGDLTLASAVSMTLAGGAQAHNVFWQVSGQATFSSGSHFEGIVLCQTGITMQTNASLHGRLLAQTLVALDSNNIIAP